MSLLVPMLGALAVLLFVLGVARLREQPAVKAKLAALAPRGQAARPPYFERRILPLAKRIGPRFKWLLPALQPRGIGEKLTHAGRPWRLNAEQFLGLQILAGLAGSVTGVYLTLLFLRSAGLFVVPLLGMSAAYAPLFWLRSKAAERQRTIGQEMPEALEILSISVQAGLGFDAAVGHLVERRSGPLAEELDRFLRELKVGVPRRVAYQQLVGRNPSQELQVVVNALSQAHEFGVPIAETLNQQAEEMRERRVRRAREEGGKASPKISLVTALIIAPSAMLLMAAVVAFHVLGVLTGPVNPAF